ncbi:hypothetical protein BD410DRAFT_795503 [Rickenella mellea]|uniref:Dockerin type 1 n=1 Tax=Rickenella mellea TaxID=50990 RepID=A0A4Y7PN75_9AGAM|nr:hypothetical protein BD410DRAFT_795503 [Rickenella mellea]
MKAAGFCAIALACILPTGIAAKTVKVLQNSVLGPDPHTVNRLNGESFQMDALVTFQGFQYAAYYDASTSTNASNRFVSVARRTLSGSKTKSSTWERLTLTDYVETEDDGHDVISLGISHSDGTIHLGFNQHDNPLNYRVSKPGVATNPTGIKWTSDLFGPVLDHLPGLEALDKSIFFVNVTYPRFLSVPSSSSSSKSKSDLIFEIRVGRSGLGDDWLYNYVPGTGKWTLLGRYLEGVNNNAYINGMDFDPRGNLHVTWTYRDFINDTGQNVAVQAGPNGPENNHDLNYAFSADLGKTWQNNWGQAISNVPLQQPIVPASAGIVMFGIPKFGGILNQEGQTVDDAGRVHVLNRENTTGIEQWYHYWRDTNINWTRTPFPLNISSINNITNTPTVIGKRGKLVAFRSNLLAILPSNAPNATGLSILASTAKGKFADWTVVWEASSGCSTEPLFDRYRLNTNAGGDGVLSLFYVNGTNVQVSDVDLSGLN